MEFMRSFEELFNQTEELDVYPGKIVTGEIISKDRDGVYVGFGYRYDGFIPYAEYGADACYENVEIGTEVEAKVMQSRTKTYVVRMSKIKAEAEAAWKNVVPLSEGEKRIANVKVIRVIKNRANGTVGLVVKVEDVEGFMPASHVELYHVNNFDEYIGKEFEVEIIEIDIEKRRIVVSRKNLLKNKNRANMKDDCIDIHSVFNIAKESKNIKIKSLKIKELTGKNSEDIISISIGDLLKLTDECLKKGITQGRVKTIVNIGENTNLTLEEIVDAAIPEEEKRKKFLDMAKNKL